MTDKQQAQDIRDKIAEDTLLMLAMLCQINDLGENQVVRRAGDRVSDLRCFTDRDTNGNRPNVGKP